MLKSPISSVMIIGSMKCGTTSLYDYLTAHPEICPCEVKEPEFFSQHQEHGTQAPYYHQLWNFDGQIHKYMLEASTGYTKYPYEADVPKKIYEYGLKPKFIYLVRNPFERIVSHYNYLRVSPDFDLSIDLTDEGFVSLSKYYLQLSRFLHYFPEKDQYLILDFNDLSENPRSLLEKVFCFLSIDGKRYEAEDFSAQNKSGTFNVFELFLFRTGLIKASKLLPKQTVRIIKDLIKKGFPIFEPRKLSDREYEAIHKLLSEDMKLFSESFDFDVTRWGFTS